MLYPCMKTDTAMAVHIAILVVAGQERLLIAIMLMLPVSSTHELYEM
jgi:phosphate/sulfate permease